MRKLNEIYFVKEGNPGLTETSASHLCALANQVKAQHEATLANINFVNTTVSIVGSKEDLITEAGIVSADVKEIETALAQVSRMNAFIAWFAEARKELENYRAERTAYNLAGWCEMVGKEYPDAPKNRVLEVKMSTLEDIINEMNTKERQEYLALEAKSAVFGNFIHPNQPFEKARKKVHRIAKAGYSAEGSGRDTLVYHYVPSMQPSDVDSLFVKLQAEYRTTEQQLNHMKSDLRKTLDARNIEETNKKQELLEEYRNASQEYHNKLQKLTAEYNNWLTEENARIAKLRFCIPEKLKDTYEFLNKLGK